MDRLALIGVSHKRGGAAALESWHGGAARLLDLGLGEWTVIETCNRWDVVLALPDRMSAQALRLKLLPPGDGARPYAYTGEGALEQLCRVAASLDSLNPGEDQIMAQVREAFAASQAAGRAGALSSFAFHTALRVAKRVRREVRLAPLNTSLFSLALPALERTLGPGERVAVLGAGAMGELVAKSLRALPNERLVVNRSPERGQRLARQVGAGYLGLAEFLASPPRLGALVSALPLPEVVDEAVLDRLAGLRLAVDLGIPRNVAREAARARGVTVLDVDTLQGAGQARREALSLKLARAEELVCSEVEAAMNEWTERQLGPSIRELRAWYLRTLGESLPAEEAARLANKFAHVPVKGLRALARSYGLDAARTFLAETGLVGTGLVGTGPAETGTLETGAGNAGGVE